MGNGLRGALKNLYRYILYIYIIREIGKGNVLGMLGNGKWEWEFIAKL